MTIEAKKTSCNGHPDAFNLTQQGTTLLEVYKAAIATTLERRAIVKVDNASAPVEERGVTVTPLPGPPAVLDDE